MAVEVSDVAQQPPAMGRDGVVLPTLDACVSRATDISAQISASDREIQARLQAPLPDALLSWKPGPVRKRGQGYVAVFFPYVDDSFYRDRLDTVLGLTGWQELYSDQKELTECTVILRMPSGAVRTGVGVGKFTSRDEDEGNSEKGVRTMAFRDACKHLGICGRDIDGAQTIPVEVDIWEKNGKTYINEVLEPLSRKLLRHSGQSTYKVPSYIRSVVLLTEDPMASKYLDVAEAIAGGDKEVERQVRQAADKPALKQEQAPPQERGDFKDGASWVWPFGKHKGVTLGETPSGYLEWALEKGDMCNPEKGDKYDEWLHQAIQYVLHAKAGDKLEAAGETRHEWVDVKKEKPGKMAMANTTRGGDKTPEEQVFGGEITDEDIPEGL